MTTLPKNLDWTGDDEGVFTATGVQGTYRMVGRRAGDGDAMVSVFIDGVLITSCAIGYGEGAEQANDWELHHHFIEVA